LKPTQKRTVPAKKLLVGQNVSPEQMSRFGAKELMVLSHAAAWV